MDRIPTGWKLLPQEKFYKITWGVLLFPAMMAAGCGGLGASTLPTDRNSYNIAIQRSNDEQLLLNLVRLEYRDTPSFLEVSSVAAQFTYSASLSVSAMLPFASGPNILGLGGGAAVTEKPTVTYTPLQGEQFIQRFLSRLPLETVFLLGRSGWNIDRVLRLCLQRLGELKNAPGASGPTPSHVPAYKKFARVVKLLREMQIRDALDISLEHEKGFRQLVMRVKQEASGWPPELRELNDTLGVSPHRTRYVLTTHPLPDDPDSLKVETRSQLGIMYYLSQSVEAPQRDREQGKVTITRYPSGEIFDWAEVTGDILRIRSQPDRPDDAAVAIRYRGSWFYVDDSDLNSKSTLSLLAQIFALQAGKIKSTAPVLTLPIGQ